MALAFLLLPFNYTLGRLKLNSQHLAPAHLARTCALPLASQSFPMVTDQTMPQALHSYCSATQNALRSSGNFSTPYFLFLILLPLDRVRWHMPLIRWISTTLRPA